MLTSIETANLLQQLNSNGVDLTLEELLRYRGLAGSLKLQPGRRAQSAQSGAERSLFKGRGMEFDEARYYQPGDDIRSIDWRVTARTGKTHTKIFREERERPVFLFVDLSDSMKFGTELLFKSVQASHLAALLGFAAVGRGDKLGAVIFNQFQDIEVKPSARQRAVLHVLDLLLKGHQVTGNKPGENPALNALQRLRFIAKPGSLVHIISDFSQFSDAHFDILGSMTRHCEILATQVYDRFEQVLPAHRNFGQLTVTDGVQNQSVDLSDNQILSHYQKSSQQRQAYLKEKFTDIRVSLRSVNAGSPITEQLTLSKTGYVVGSQL